MLPLVVSFVTYYVLNIKTSTISVSEFISPPLVKPEGTIGLHSVRPSVSLSVSLSVCPSHSFSGLFFAMLSHIWMKVGSKLLYEELQIEFDFRHGWPIFMSYCPLFKISFPDFSSLCFHISEWKLVGKLPYEELQIKFDFRHVWPTFSWVIALCSKFVFRTFLHSAFTYLNESW